MDLVKVPNKRLSLTEGDFTTLVNGNIIVKDGVEITLQDIGLTRLKNIVNTCGETHLTQTELNRLCAFLKH
jgi:hypothetical protein